MHIVLTLDYSFKTLLFYKKVFDLLDNEIFTFFFYIYKKLKNYISQNKKKNLQKKLIKIYYFVNF